MVRSHPSPVYGKYRGVVTDNIDPEHLGRIQARVPSLLGQRSTGWATPCIPYAGQESDGTNVGFFLIPPVGANVWIEFEEGQLEYPIWSGCFWANGQVPSGATSPYVKVIATDFANITIDDQGHSLAVQTKTGLKMTMDASGITLSNGPSSSIALTQASVSINNGALEVV